MAVKRYDGSQWVTVAGKGDQGTSSSIATWVKTATGGETSVSGNDDNSQPLSYTVGQELVFINGALQKRGSDYTATTGNSITGLTALAANDVVTVWTVNAFSVTGAIANTIVDAKGDLLVGTAADTPGRLAVGTDGQVLKADSTTGTGLAWGSAGSAFVGCSLYKTANQTISHDTITQVTFDAEAYDTDGFHSTSTNTSRITIPTGKSGKYLFTFQTQWDLNGTGDRSIYYYKNGANGTAMVRYSIVSGSYYTIQNASIVLDLVAGDYIEMYVLQSSGGNLNIQYDTNTAQSSRIRFSASYLGA